jgi:ribosomal protein S18 acetylase RimI-like enzyme
MANHEIEATTIQDVPDLCVVLDQTGLFPSDMLPDMLAPSLTEDAPGVWLSCKEEGKAIGFAYTVPEEMADGTWNMLALAVLPDLQKKGIGAALVAATEKHLAAKHQRILIVETSSTIDYAGARSFYSKCGYDEEARIRDFWAAGDDKVIFRKAIG